MAENNNRDVETENTEQNGSETLDDQLENREEAGREGMRTQGARQHGNVGQEGGEIPQSPGSSQGGQRQGVQQPSSSGHQHGNQQQASQQRQGQQPDQQQQTGKKPNKQPVRKEQRP